MTAFAHFAAAGPADEVERFEPVNVVVRATDDPEVIVFEFAYAISAGGRDSELPCIFVIRVRDGRDYSHHVGLARALGRLDEPASALVAQRSAGYQAWSAPQCGQSTEVDTGAVKT